MMTSTMADADEVADHAGEHVGEGLLGAGHVVVEAAHQGAGLRAREEGERHALHVVEHLRAHVVDEALADPRADEALDEGEPGVGDREHGDEHGEPDDERRRRCARMPLVDDRAVEQRVGGADHGVDHDQHEEEGQQPAVRA